MEELKTIEALESVRSLDERDTILSADRQALAEAVAQRLQDQPQHVLEFFLAMTSPSSEVCDDSPRSGPEANEIQPKPEDTVDGRLADYETTDMGRRFLCQVKAASDFTQRTTKRGLLMSEVEYFRLLAYRDIWDAINKAYKLGYWRGYNKARRSK